MFKYAARSDPSSAAAASAASVDLHTRGERQERQSNTEALCGELTASGLVTTIKTPSSEVECGPLLQDASVYVAINVCLLIGMSWKIMPWSGVDCKIQRLLKNLEVSNCGLKSVVAQTNCCTKFWSSLRAKPLQTS